MNILFITYFINTVAWSFVLKLILTAPVSNVLSLGRWIRKCALSGPLIRMKISKLSALRKFQVDGWFLRYIIAAMSDMMNSQKVYFYLYSNCNFIHQGGIVFFP